MSAKSKSLPTTSDCCGTAKDNSRVGLGATAGPVRLCYCFDITIEDVELEIAAKGSSSVPERIVAAVRAGTCECEIRNPAGVCCLGEVNRAVKAATVRSEETRST